MNGNSSIGGTGPFLNASGQQTQNPWSNNYGAPSGSGGSNPWVIPGGWSGGGMSPYSYKQPTDLTPLAVHFGLMPSTPTLSPGESANWNGSGWTNTTPGQSTGTTTTPTPSPTPTPPTSRLGVPTGTTPWPTASGYGPLPSDPGTSINGTTWMGSIFPNSASAPTSPQPNLAIQKPGTTVSKLNWNPAWGADPYAPGWTPPSSEFPAPTVDPTVNPTGNVGAVPLSSPSSTAAPAASPSAGSSGLSGLDPSMISQLMQYLQNYGNPAGGSGGYF